MVGNRLYIHQDEEWMEEILDKAYISVGVMYPCSPRMYYTIFYH